MRTALLLSCLLVPAMSHAEEIALHHEPFAVVELFTSESCSSCPPADVVLSELDAAARKDGTRIFPLAFHVDYWDRLGWKDRFSSAAATQRQCAYAETFRSQRVYTPQMIITGASECIGSRRGRAEKAVKQALDEPSLLGIGFIVEPAEDAKSVRVHWRLSEKPENATLQLAIVENGLATDVRRGENGGRTLRHDAVVRAFQTIDITDTQGDLTLTLPTDVDPDQASVVLFVQDEAMRILAAHRSDLGE